MTRKDVFTLRHREACKAVAIQGGKATERLDYFVGFIVSQRQPDG